ncbi:NYN domain-containing protein [Nodosilinea sp. P-1105]|uniref:NYN domain-containing protein n=1 Tax=Nodosilinea sp. P-1105 TaxID=2546229 RepID=UPI00146BC14C|nr:NYN domain-containing protein [Nodosilinea sp. P-1105]NMF83904.1 NYN domain-containing protein [Nodosilinea sp. P-1105]
MEDPKYIARLLVDGYNMVGAWPTLLQTKQRHGFDAARQELIEILANYSARKGLDTYLVFDAHGVRSPSSRDVITQNLSVCYTAFGQTADSYIERICSQFRQRSARNHRIIVATSDRAQQLTVVGYGAEWMSARQLEGDIRLTTAQGQRQSYRKTKVANRSIMGGLDEEARAKLIKLRFGLR